jgi:hypothetical protein
MCGCQSLQRPPNDGPMTTGRVLCKPAVEGHGYVNHGGRGIFSRPRRVGQNVCELASSGLIVTTKRMLTAINRGPIVARRCAIQCGPAWHMLVSGVATNLAVEESRVKMKRTMFPRYGLAPATTPRPLSTYERQRFESSIAHSHRLVLTNKALTAIQLSPFHHSECGDLWLL